MFFIIISDGLLDKYRAEQKLKHLFSNKFLLVFKKMFDIFLIL